MPELSVAAVEQYTQGRLDRDDPMTADLLAEGLSTARRWCGWHVTPVIEDDVHTIDGPGSRLLTLPTLRLVELTAITEDGTALVPSTDLDVSPRGLVVKRGGGWWSTRFGGISVTMTHGFESALDFNAAVLSLIARTADAASGLPTTVGPFQWPSGDGGPWTAIERGRLEQYRLEAPA